MLMKYDGCYQYSGGQVCTLPFPTLICDSVVADESTIKETTTDKYHCNFNSEKVPLTKKQTISKTILVKTVKTQQGQNKFTNDDKRGKFLPERETSGSIRYKIITIVTMSIPNNIRKTTPTGL